VRVLDLFSGIGGFSLGLERAGMRTVAFCEVDPFCRQVLAQRWPGVPVYGDVRELTGARLVADGIAADVICGGFPCQDISNAGHRVGIDGERSRLWVEFARLIGEVRPRYALVENVAALTFRGLLRVLGDLAEIGYDAEWHCIPASHVGAHHRRDRVWIVAYPDRDRRDVASDVEEGAERASLDAARPPSERWTDSSGAEAMADAERRRLQGRDVERPEPPAIITAADSWHRGRRELGEAWRVEPDVGRVAYGVPAQVDRLRSLGNAVVPQIPEAIGRAIMTQQSLEPQSHEGER
jgi:DNA (cytosine-5)-methyltransferase 1